MWLIYFAVFRVHVYCFYAYILTTNVQSRFLFYFQLKIHDKFNSMFQILIKTFWPFKIKTKAFRISYYDHVFFHDYNYLIKLLQTFLVILLCWYKRYSIRLISFFDLYVFPAFICANNIGKLVNSLFGVNIFNPVPSFFLFQ